MTLQSFIAKQAGDSGPWSAYVRLASELALADVAAALGKATGLRLRESQGFDEFDAYAAEIGDHEFRVTVPSGETGLRDFEIVLEPGPYCDAEGDPVDLSEGLAEWLQERAPQLAEFESMG